MQWLKDLNGTRRRIAEPPAGYRCAQRYPLTLEEYLEYEEHSRIRHEYLAGDIFAMSGATKRHNRTAGRFYRAFAEHLGGDPCETCMSDVKVKITVNRNDYVYYPDVMVVCGRDSTEDRYVADPKVIVGVLSGSTIGVDRNEKRVNYRWIPTLEEYVVAAQDWTEVSVYRRGDDWRPVGLRTSTEAVEVRSIGLSLPLAGIYEGESM